MNKSVQEEFISTVSHELRTPLTSIRGFSQTLLSSWDKLDEQNKKKFVKIIEEQSNRLINLVENILTVSKLNEDKPLFKNVEINSSISKVIQMLSQKYPNHKIFTNFSSNKIFARLDDNKFQQIMTNLIDNACKYSEEGKPIEIKTCVNGNEIVNIKVRDEGVGIAGNSKEIFDKFVRLENHLTSKTQGNGLGLYITKNLVENMNGKINYESELGKGTEFILEFP